jgi:hypothetical protein
VVTQLTFVPIAPLPCSVGGPGIRGGTGRCRCRHHYGSAAENLLPVRGLESTHNQVGSFTPFRRPSSRSSNGIDSRRTRALALGTRSRKSRSSSPAKSNGPPNPKSSCGVDSISPALALQAMTLGVRGMQGPGSQAAGGGSLRVSGSLVRKGSPGWSRRRAAGVPNLRENQVLRRLTQDLKNRETATHPAVRKRTVKVYLTRLLPEAGAKVRFELACFRWKSSAPGKRKRRTKMCDQACASRDRLREDVRGTVQRISLGLFL